MIDKKYWLSILAISVVLVAGSLAVTPIANADDDDDDDDNDDDDNDEFKAKLKGSKEVPSISTTGKGTFKAELSDDGDSLSFKLKYNNLEGTVEQAHIHFAQKGVNGEVIAFLCTDFNDPAGLAPECPGTSSGRVSGTLTADNVIGPEDQGIESGEFDEFISALKNGKTYVNVHTDKFQSGEIRGQIRD